MSPEGFVSLPRRQGRVRGLRRVRQALGTYCARGEPCERGGSPGEATALALQEPAAHLLAGPPATERQTATALRVRGNQERGWWDHEPVVATQMGEVPPES